MIHLDSNLARHAIIYGGQRVLLVKEHIYGPDSTGTAERVGLSPPTFLAD